MGRRFTVFNEPLAAWAEAMLEAALLKKPPPPPQPKAHVLTWSQLRHLGLGVRPEYLADALLPEEALWDVLHAGFARACLVHSNRPRRVCRRRGDTPPIVDIAAPALSARGVSLTSSEESLARLHTAAKEHGYDSPFWFTREELEYFILPRERLQLFLNCDMSRFSTLAQTDKRIPSVEVIKEDGEIFHVMNICEFAKSSSPNKERGVNQHGLLHVFRQFAPINVLTKCPFAPDIEDVLRRHSIMYGCWCSLWGTPHDFKALGFEVLEGPLGVWVFDDLDLPVFLINAFSCVNPKAVFSHVYSNDIITFV